MVRAFEVSKTLCEIVAFATRNMMSTSCLQLLNFETSVNEGEFQRLYPWSSHNCHGVHMPKTLHCFLRPCCFGSMKLLVVFTAQAKKKAQNATIILRDQSNISKCASAHCGNVSRRKWQSLVRDPDGPG